MTHEFHHQYVTGQMWIDETYRGIFARELVEQQIDQLESFAAVRLLAESLFDMPTANFDVSLIFSDW